MLKWVLEINFISPFLEVVSGTATLIDSNFSVSLYEKLIILEIRKEPGSTCLKTIFWKDGFMFGEDAYDFLKQQLDSYHCGLKMQKECHFWFPDYLQKEYEEGNHGLQKTRKGKDRSKKKTKNTKTRKKKISTIT